MVVKGNPQSPTFHPNSSLSLSLSLSHPGAPRGLLRRSGLPRALRVRPQPRTFPAPPTWVSGPDARGEPPRRCTARRRRRAADGPRPAPDLAPERLCLGGKGAAPPSRHGLVRLLFGLPLLADVPQRSGVRGAQAGTGPPPPHHGGGWSPPTDLRQVRPPRPLAQRGVPHLARTAVLRGRPSAGNGLMAGGARPAGLAPR